MSTVLGQLHSRACEGTHGLQAWLCKARASSMLSASPRLNQKSWVGGPTAMYTRLKGQSIRYWHFKSTGTIYRGPAMSQLLHRNKAY